MNTIFDELSFFYGWKPQSGTFAVEIETETKSIDDYHENGVQITEKMGGDWSIPNLKTWNAKKDGSLRDFGVEFVSKKPLPLSGIIASLDEFEVRLKNVPFIENSPSTSVHVHVNATQLSMTSFGNFLTTWMLFENLLVEFSGETRRSNLFALPNRCAEGCCKNIVSMFSQLEQGSPTGMKWHEGSVKYAALNIGRLSSLGSLELRCFRGTTKIEDIKEWIYVLNDIFRFSQTEGMNPRHIVVQYRRNPTDLIHDVFRDSWVYLKKVVERIDAIKYADRNIWYAAMIADSVRSWEKLDTLFSKARADKPGKTRKPAPKPQPNQFLDLDGEVNWDAYEEAIHNWEAQNVTLPWAEGIQLSNLTPGGPQPTHVVYDDLED